MVDPLAEAREALTEELARAARESGAPASFHPELERPRDPEHGDLASNAALVLAGRLERPPRELAEEIAGRVNESDADLASLDVAGPGFLNVRFTDRLYREGLVPILEADRSWGRSDAAEPRRVVVEFVSANPTGPLHVAHGRGAALGDGIASLLEWTGHEVVREFYVNDAGRQIELLGESVLARARQLAGGEAAVPEDGYHGDYVRELADRLDDDDDIARLAARAATLLREEHARDLEEFGVRMDTWREESALYEEGAVEEILERLDAAGLTYESEGALWLATERLGDEKDRVLVKSDGSYTYFLPDIAYHVDKAERGFERAIDIWGADHHGHIARMKAALDALDLPEDFLEVVILQLVTVMRGDEEVRMSKRAGEFVTLRALFEETGTDVARYFFLMRRAEVPLTFDLELAMDRSDANPVYKIQYAHARMCSVFARGGIDPDALSPTPAELARLETSAERELARTLLRFPAVVRSAARGRAPYQVCNYLEEAAGRVNAWYHEGNVDASLRVLADGAARPARLALARAVQITLRNGLALLGLSAPERMVREDEEAEKVEA